MKKVLLFFLFVVFCVIPPKAFADEGWVINSFHSDITIQNDGTVMVKELIDVDFQNLEKHGIYRDIPYVYSQNESPYYTEIILSQVIQDGDKAQVETSKNNNNIRFRIGDPNRTISGKHTYEINYQVRGVLMPYSDYDEFYWNVTGNDWGVPIQKSSAKVSLSADVLKNACFQGVFGSEDSSCLSNQLEKNATFESSRSLLPYEGLTIVVGYKKGIIPIITVERPKSIFEQALSPLGILLFLISSSLTVGYALWLWWKWGRDFWWRKIPILAEKTNSKEELKPPFAHQQIVVEYEPPENLRPAEIGVLVDEKADTLDVAATIIDLATRGYLSITEEPKKWLFGSTDYTLKQEKKDTSRLLSYEKELLSRLFDTGDIVSVSGLKTTFYQDLAKVKEKLYEQVVTKKLFPENPDTVRVKYLFLGIGLIIAGVLLIIWGGSNELFYSLNTGAGIILGGFVVLLLSRAMSRRSAHGSELYRRTKGYHMFISKVETYKQQFFERKNMFNEILPYAIVFGLTGKFAQAMKDMGVKPDASTWYHGHSTFNPVVFSSHINSFSSSLSSAIASAPKSSGFSGGSSGGGFGGGGGGSW